MNRNRVLIAFMMMLAAEHIARAAEAQGNLYQLGIATNQEGLPGAWKQIGKSGAFKNVKAGAILKSQLYTLEAEGSLFSTSLENGERRRIGRGDFGATVFICSNADALFTIESSGNLYKVAAADGHKSQVGSAGGWIGFHAGTVFKDRLYTAEKDGSLHATDLESGDRKKIGGADFANAYAMAGAGESLCVVESDGDFLRVNPTTGEKSSTGHKGKKHTKPVLGLVAVKGRLFTIDTAGFLYELPSSGKKTQLGKADFANTKFMFAGEKKAYTIEDSGDFYLVDAYPDISPDDWDCFPREFEKVFREQASSLFGKYEARQILGSRVTHAGIMEGIRWLHSKATANDLVVIYITMHGGTDPKEGWRADTADGKLLMARDLKAEFAKFPCHVLLFLESCFCGGFAFPHHNDPPVPPNVTVKRGNGAVNGNQPELEGAAQMPVEELVALNEALDALAALDADAAEVVKLRYFAGLEMSEIAEVLGMARSTVYDNWEFAKVWLLKRLGT